MMKKRAYQQFLVASLLWFSLCELRAVTINAASAGNADITAAIASAVTGDTVVVPAGTVTWTGTVVIPNGKNIILQGAGVQLTAIGTFTVAGNVVTLPAHGLTDGTIVRLSSTGALPTRLVGEKDYFVRDSTTNTFKLAGTSNGAAIVFSGTGTGVHSLSRCVWQTVCTTTTSPGVDMRQTTSRLTGFDFNSTGTADTIFVAASGRGFRIDHCRLESAALAIKTHVSSIGLLTVPHPTGLIDHCQLLNGRVLVRGNLDDVPTRSGAIWAAPLGLGTGEAVFVEDNACVYTLANGPTVDANHSARIVFRHNDVQDCFLTVHDTAGGYRATRMWEFYENEIYRAATFGVYWPIFLRAGTGVCYNNTVTGTYGSGVIGIDNRRTSQNDSVSSQSTGSYGGNPVDGNTALSDGSGTHTGSNGAPFLTDSTRTWTVDKFKVVCTASSIPQCSPPPQNRWFHVYNLTDGSKGQISANDATTVTAPLAGGTRNNWNTGDIYKISDGYPTRDQIGRSTDQWQWTAENPYPPQGLDPAYFWGNTKNGAPLSVRVENNCYRHIQPGRDYYDSVSTPKPGYTPYVYPHPLQGPRPPVGLRVAPPG